MDKRATTNSNIGAQPRFNQRAAEIGLTEP